MISLEHCIARHIPRVGSMFPSVFRSFSTVQSLDSLPNDAILEKLNKKEVSVHKLESAFGDASYSASLQKSSSRRFRRMDGIRLHSFREWP